MDPGFWTGLTVMSAVFALWFFVARAREQERRAQRERERPHCSASWVRERLKGMAEPSLLLVPASAPGFSKLGGDPDLPAGFAWPTDHGRPRHFLAQIDLADARRSGGPAWLPDTGRLYAFYDPERHGYADVVCMRYSSGRSAVPTSPPSHETWRYPERRVDLAPVTSLPNLEWIGVFHHRLDEDNHPGAWDELARLADAPPDDQMQHRIGGYPNEIQDAQMALECEHHLQGLPGPAYEMAVTEDLQRAADEWRLLIQIDSDPELNMEWGDAGRLYVFIRKADAAAAEFNKTVALWQTH